MLAKQARLAIGLTPALRDALRRSSTAILPEIDVALLHPAAQTDKRAAELRRLRHACESCGFFSARTTEFCPPALIQATYGVTRAFHALPADVKQEYHHRKNRNSRGWVPLGEEPNYESDDAGAVVSHVTSFDMARDLPPDDPMVVAGVKSMGSNIWVADRHVRGFQAASQAYYAATTDIAGILYRAFAEMMNLPPDTFTQYFTRYARGTMRMMEYPGAASSAAVLSARNAGITAHTDFEAFTLLHSDAPGLQLTRGAHSSDWVDAPVPDVDHQIVILGDCLEMFTNGVLQATRHRVLHVAQQRFSLVRFVGVQGDTLVQPLPQFGAPLYAPVTQSDHIENAMDLAEQRRRKLAAAGITVG